MDTGRHLTFKAFDGRMASLHFCSESNNLLYPRVRLQPAAAAYEYLIHLTDVQAEPARRILVYACRICQYDEIGENMCVYRNDLVTVTYRTPICVAPLVVMMIPLSIKTNRSGGRHV
ncbi:hypothetical protein JB92DRAFT_2178049 [Gautieria morchelliformis]|nr:hypothetical protein JB92DRAFT_2178049 [Gautieria morchelliformis]